MTYVIGEPCVDVLDRACVEEYPVDCIYEGERMLSLPGRDEPLGSPGDAAKLGVVSAGHCLASPAGVTAYGQGG
jgi:hypothetical protein